MFVLRHLRHRRRHRHGQTLRRLPRMCAARQQVDREERPASPAPDPPRSAARPPPPHNRSPTSRLRASPRPRPPVRIVHSTQNAFHATIVIPAIAIRVLSSIGSIRTPLSLMSITATGVDDPPPPPPPPPPEPSLCPTLPGSPGSNPLPCPPPNPSPQPKFTPA